MKHKFETSLSSMNSTPDHLSKRPATGKLNELSVDALLTGLEAGDFQAIDVVEDCLARIARREPAVRAWISIDAEGARAAALNRSGDGKLCGIPFGVKDVFRTAGCPTLLGSAIPPSSVDRRDAAVVALLRMAGGVMIGKTATAEFAGTAPPETCHPELITHSPGGSSSGSAAAVADFMVPFALGTQTGGSIIRPAAFCGIVGFKPSYGLYPVDGLKMAAQSFDTVGLLTRTVGDAALVHSVLLGSETTAPADKVRIGLIRTHLDGTVQPAARDALEIAAQQLAASGYHVEEGAAPGWLRDLTAHRAVVNAFERYQALAPEAASDFAFFRPESKATFENGRAITAEAYLHARGAIDTARHKAAELFTDIDILLAPSTAGEAPEGLGSTGDPRLQELWTVLHLPTLCLPCGRGPAGLPLSVQLIAPLYQDARLLAAASRLEQIVGRLPEPNHRSGL